MLNMLEPVVSCESAVEANSTFLADMDQVVTQTVEYTQGSESSPYFIPSSLCE